MAVGENAAGRKRKLAPGIAWISNRTRPRARARARDGRALE